MAITYNAGTNVITVTAYTEGTPCNFTDIYNADVAGSWGVVTRQCTNQFCFDCALKIGDGSTTTWFADEAKHITFIGAPIEKTGEGVEDRWTFLLKANSNVRLGKLEDAGDKTTSKGCSIIFNNTNHTCFGTVLSSPPSTAHLNIYSTQIQSTSSYVCFVYGLDGMKIYDSSFVRYTFPAICKNVNFNNFLINNGYNGINGTSGTMNNIDIINSDKAIAVGSSAVVDVVIKNAMFKNNNYVVYMSSAAKDAYLINVDADSWLFLFVSSATKTCYRQYEFDLKVIDKDNSPINAATVKIWDKDSNLIVDTTTNASGVIAAQTITRGTYAQATGSTLQEKSPHLIKIEKANYTTYEADFTLGDKIDWLIALQAAGGGLMRNPPMTGGMV